MTKFTRRIVEVGVLALALVGSACGDDDDPNVVIESPANDSTITATDDVDPVLDGIQVAVDVAVMNESDGEEVWLYTDGSVLTEMPDAEPTLVETLTDGVVTFQPTLEPGVHALVACVRDCRHRSQQVRVTVVAGCGGIVFIDPAPAEGDVTQLGPADDIDGVACDDGTFTTNVRLTTTVADGTALQLFVNGAPGPTTTAAGGQALFANVVLGERGSDPNTLRVQVTDDAGGTCTQEYPNSILVDCDGTSCSLTLPDADRSFLNADDDVSAADGFQADFEVTGGIEASGESFNLIVDGDILTAVSSTSGGNAVAQFDAIDLSEGRHSVVAECFDELGNRTRTEPAQWIVDTIPCDVSVSEPVADTLFIDDDDVDDTVDGIQIDVAGTVSGVACTGVTAGPCGGAGSSLALTGSSFGGNATLASTPMQEMCVIVTDEAGNTGESRIPLRVRTDAPQLQIVTPTSGTVFNETGAMGGTADLDPATDACDIAATVNCTEVGAPVELVAVSSGTVLGTADCVAMAGLPSPFTGQATFASAAVPSRNDGSSGSIVARQTVDRLTGMSAPVDVVPDCDEPTLTFFDPTCGSTLSPTTDDADPGTPGFQYRVRVINLTSNEADLTTLTAVDSGGGTVLSAMSTTRTGESIFFDADLGAGGELTLRACATDDAGNTGCTPDCPVTILDLPAVAITSPGDGASLSGADDCDGGSAGLQVRVTGTTDAPDASSASVTFGSLAPQPVAISGGVIDACVDADQGGGVTVVLSVDDGGAVGTASIMVDVDSNPPTDVISDLALGSVIDRRGGIARLQYTSVSDEDGSTLAQTEIRCSLSPIDDEGDWNAASVFASRVAASPSSLVAEDVPGFKVGVEYFCEARSSDIGGNLTGLSGTGGTSIQLDFLSQTIALGSSVGMGVRAMPIGDVDGDLMTDFIIGGDNSAYLFFGRTSFAAASEAPDVIFQGSGGFGNRVSGLGDFNGDGISDFAVAARSESSVYVFFGRASRADWGSDPIVVGPSECPAAARALCIRGPSGEFLGWHLSSVGDFNGDGIADLAAGAPVAYGLVGTHYILLGSTAYGTTSTSAMVETLVGFEVTSSTAPARTFIGSSAVYRGDGNIDGRDDVVLGATGSSSAGVAGRARLLDGRDHSGGAGLDPIDWDGLTEISTGIAGSFAVDIFALGDITGGGATDVGIRVGTSAGNVQVFTGESGFLTGFQVSNDLPSSASDTFGIRSANGINPALGGMGQIDGASGMELLLASEQAGTGPGDARLWYAPTSSSTVRSSAPTIFPATSGTGGVSAGFVGDINADGHMDIAIGEPQAASGAGLVTLYY